ncbi:MAG: Hsp20/alpha crystallin family protein [bacterium]|nr:Hsp20/alpha crystallin family protein [bacterium]MDE0287365.1 Hsp20/alpha crystallin family protein [bacterium]MDE0439192.1 Hsp20/alpha crystallin family protein [bacterium]
MHLVRTRPFRLAHDVEALFGALPRPSGYRFGFREGRIAPPAWLPGVDIIESDDSLTLRYGLAGFRSEDLEVTLDDNVLTVRGARSPVIPEGAAYRLQELVEGNFSRSIRVGQDIDSDEVEATFSGGILEVVLRKRPDVAPRAIPIEPAGD